MTASGYYEDKIQTLRELFGTDEVQVATNALLVRERSYPIVDDVIVLLDESEYPQNLRERLGLEAQISRQGGLRPDVQFTFGHEWESYPDILPEHGSEFAKYFDLIDIDSLADSRVLDLGCGIGRWSYFLKDSVRELVLVDFSDAIFVARRNLADADNAVFVMGDLTRLPFGDNISDLTFSLGVLHHLPQDALQQVRALKRLSPEILVYLYWSLDGAPSYFKGILFLADLLRRGVSKVKSALFRKIFSWMVSVTVYMPLVICGKMLSTVGLERYVPLYEFYNKKSVSRIEQDVYDRFFTTIEQRVSRGDIMSLTDTFSDVTISPALPYWHFRCQR